VFGRVHSRGTGRSVQLLAELEELLPEVLPVIGDLTCDLLFAESGLAGKGAGTHKRPGRSEEARARVEGGHAASDSGHRGWMEVAG
jgi:hypothetical protein